MEVNYHKVKKMRKLKYVVSVLLFSLSLSASAATLSDHFIDFSGEYFMSGVLYSTGADPITSEARGIGTVNEIRDGSGNLLWSSGQYGSWVNFVYSDYFVNYLSAPDIFTGASNYTETLGKVAFYEATSDVFNATGNWAADSANIITNSFSPFATLEGSLRTIQTLSYSVYGTVSPTNVDGHGALNITGGTYGADFDTNAMLWGSVLSDVSFDYAATNVNTAGYAYSGTALAKGLITPVPEPTSLFLLGIGLIGLPLFSRKVEKYTRNMTGQNELLAA